VREPAPDYLTSQYERPNQPWVCGLAEHGHACPAGPTARGYCPALAECNPVRDGDRWACNRSALRGGPCEQGPTPDGGCCRVNKCVPVRSLRAKRGRFITACACLVLGLIAIALSADWRNQVLRPGPLVQQHAQLLARPGVEPNCGACHAAASQNVAGWAASLVVAHDDHPTQSQLCMNCHAKSISKQNALAAHSLPPGVLEHITAARGAAAPPPPRDVACATCHREHHGALADLTALDNAACQACHQQRFTSFAANHPDFGNWPYKRRTPIVFNHATHSLKHFAEKHEQFDCRRCHVGDPTSGVERLATYEQACAECHDEKIGTSIARGVPMLALPTLDVDALAKAGHNIGAWPKAAVGDFDGRLPPMMKLLLAADPAAAEALKSLGPDFEFQDVDPADAEQLAASAKLAAATKALLADLSSRGARAVIERLSTALGRDVSEAEAATLTAGLSADTIRGAASWVPGLLNQNESVTTSAGSMPSPSFGASLERGNMLTRPQRGERIPPQHKLGYEPAGAWSRDDATVSVRYRPAAHADPVLAAWLDVLAKTPQIESRPIAKAMLKELTKATAPGLCASCHSVEHSSSGGGLIVNWQANDRSTEPRGFTKFTHTPHLVLPQLERCTSCHTVDDAASAMTAPAEWDPHRFVSDFKPMSKAACAACHTAAAAGDRCQSCHNYHVEVAEGWRLAAPARASAKHAMPSAQAWLLEAQSSGGGNFPMRAKIK